jgi:hypothetical protein
MFFTRTTMIWLSSSDGADQNMWAYKSKQCQFVKNYQFEERCWLQDYIRKHTAEVKWMTLARDRSKSWTLVSNRVARSGSVPESWITDANWSKPHACKDPWQPWRSAAAVQIGHAEDTGKYSHCEGGSGWRLEEPDLRNCHNLLLWPQPQTPKLFFPHTDTCGLQTDIQLLVHISHADITFGFTHLGIFYFYWWQHASPSLNEIIKAKRWDWWDI